jgi:hypothetical protein
LGHQSSDFNCPPNGCSTWQYITSSGNIVDLGVIISNYDYRFDAAPEGDQEEFQIVTRSRT